MEKKESLVRELECESREYTGEEADAVGEKVSWYGSVKGVKRPLMPLYLFLVIYLPQST